MTPLAYPGIALYTWNIAPSASPFPASAATPSISGFLSARFSTILFPAPCAAIVALDAAPLARMPSPADSTAAPTNGCEVSHHQNLEAKMHLPRVSEKAR